MSEEWVAALDGARLFDLLPPGAPFSGGERCEARVVVHEGQALVQARGPWWRITCRQLVESGATPL